MVLVGHKKTHTHTHTFKTTENRPEYLKKENMNEDDEEYKKKELFWISLERCGKTKKSQMEKKRKMSTKNATLKTRLFDAFAQLFSIRTVVVVRYPARVYMYPISTV